MNPAEIFKNREQRGHIMRVMAMFYPEPVTVRQLKIALIERYEVSYSVDIDKHIYYLANDMEKGRPPYISVEGGYLDLTDDNKKIYMTTSGVDLIEGQLKNSSIML
ncbi:hypothetical protein [Metasolibacillus meyeri]|uniref:hypothetical protein n=1 Tax=Metasolibacillus meyeri TaxID=1071052 RepID=UPI000D308897|nr:hypothetical protein [Metasolibacillus meyeri]